MSKRDDEVLAVYAAPVKWEDLCGNDDIVRKRIIRVYEAGLEDGACDALRERQDREPSGEESPR